MTAPVKHHITSELVDSAASMLVRYPFRRWFYGDSIAFEGLIAASRATGNQRWQWFAYGFLRGWAADPEPFKGLDNTVPGHALCVLYRMTEDDVLLDAAQKLASYLITRRRIFDVYVSFERAPLHPPYGGAMISAEDANLIAEPGGGIFVDPLHFDPPFFAHLAQLTGDHELEELAGEQAIGYSKVLQDPTTGLFAHFRLEKTGEAHGKGWSRGQGWALLGLVDTICLLPTTSKHREQLLGCLRRLVDALVATQRADGHWYSVADDPGSGDESSTAAFVAAGFLELLARGLDDRTEVRIAAERAVDATLASVSREGLLSNVSRCVWPCTVPSHYAAVPKGDPEPWGQGPLLLALERAMEHNAA